MDLLTSFKNYLFSQEVQPSKVTVKNYLSDINHFINWFTQKYNSHFIPGQINAKTLEQYKQDNASTFSASSMQRHLSSLRKFFKFLKAQEQITFDPFETLASSKPEEKDYWKLKDFKSSLFDTNAAHLTIKNYIIDIKQFITWAKETTGLDESILPARISKEFIEEYKLALSNTQGFSPASVNRKLSSLRKYLSWAEAAGILTEKVLDFTNINEAKQKLFIPEASETSQEEIKAKTYSRFPPFRLFQKISQGALLAFDAALVLPIASFAKKGQDLAWTLRGKPIFHKSAQTFQIKNITHKDLLGIRNISKKVFAPSTIAISSLSPLQRVIFHARYTRPNWYKRYHSYAITHYFHFAVFIIVIVGITLGFYNSFFGNQSKLSAAPNLPTAPNRILSFQGRLTDNNDNPITSPSNLRFAIYTQQTPGTGAGILLWQEVDQVTPDTDGIFNTLLGSGPACANPISIATGQCAIPSTLFAQNAALFLGVTVESTSELTPRQQIATVAYAANSETLQGLLPITATAAGTSNVVLALDSSGNLTIGGSASPSFSASGGQFKLSGQPLLLTTNDSSNSNVTISPDGTGKIDLQKALQNNTLSTNIRSGSNGAFTAAGAVEVNDQFAILATSSGQSAFTVNQDSTGPVISASVSGLPVFTVDNGGNISNSGNYSVAGSTGISVTGNGAGLTFSGTGNHDISASGGTLRLGALTLNGAITGGNQNITSIGNISANSSGNTITGFGTIGTAATTNFTGLNLTITGSLSANGSTGSSSQCLTGGPTATWVNCSSTTNWWTQTGGVIYPIDTSLDFALGGNATASALFGVFNLNPVINTFPQATIAGRLSVASDLRKVVPGPIATISGNTNTVTLGINNNGSGDLLTASRGGQTKFTVDGRGNIVLGAATARLTQTTPTISTGNTNATLTLNGDSTGNIQFFSSSNTIDSSGNMTLAGTTGLTLSSTGGLVLNGGTISDNTDEVDINDSLAVANILQVNGTSATTYNRIGTSTTNHSLSSANDLFVTGNLEVDGSIFADAGLTVGSGQSLTLSGLTGNNQVLYANTSGVVSSVATTSTPNQCLLSGATTPSWGGCDGFWQLNQGALAPFSSKADLLIGSSATTSAKFSFTGLSDLNNRTQASISGQLIVMPNNGFGNVGIGTANPIGALTVASGQILVAGGTKTAPDIGLTGSTNTGFYFGSASGGYAAFTSAGTPKFFFQNLAQRGFVLSNNVSISWVSTSDATSVAPDVFLSRSSAGVLRVSSDESTGEGDLIVNGNLSVGTSSPISQLHVTRPLTYPATGKALAVFDQIENQEILTASASGTPVLTISRAGGIGLGGGAGSSPNYGSASQCLTGGATAAWANCVLGVNWWGQTNGVLYPIDTNLDFALGGNSTASADFAILNMNHAINTFPQATIAGRLNVASDLRKIVPGPIATISGRTDTTLVHLINNGSGDLLTASQGGNTKFTIDGRGNLVLGNPTARLTQTTPTISTGNTNATLTLNGDSTGNVQFFSSSNLITSAGNLTLGGTTITAGSLSSFTSSSSLTFAQAATTLNIGGSGGTATFGNGGAYTLATSGNQNLTVSAGSGTINLNTVSNGPVTTGTGLTTLGGSAQINGSTLTINNASATITTSTNQNLAIQPNGAGTLALGTTSTGAVSIGNTSGATSLFASGLTTNQNSVLYVGSSNNIGANNTTTVGQCLTSGASTPVWMNCNLAATAYNFWRSVNGTVYPTDLNYDLLLGGNSTSSALFAVLNMNPVINSFPQATIAGRLNVASDLRKIVPGPIATISGRTDTTLVHLINNGSGDLLTASQGGNTKFTIDGRGNLVLGNPTARLTQTTPTISTGNTNATLTLNGDSTGNVQFFSSSNTITSAGTLTIAGTQTINGTSGNGLTIANTGIAFDLVLQNGETIDNDTNNTISLGFGAAGGILNLSSTTNSVINASSRLDLQADGAIDVNIAGGSSATGCTVANSTGNLTCTGNIISLASTGPQGYWDSTSGALFPRNLTWDLLAGGNSTASASFRVSGNNAFAGTQVLASVSGTTTFAAFGINNNGVGDLFAASASGAIRYRIDNNGSASQAGSLLTLGSFGAANPVIQSTRNQTLTLGGPTTGMINVVDNTNNPFALFDTASNKVRIGTNPSTSGILTASSGNVSNVNIFSAQINGTDRFTVNSTNGLTLTAGGACNGSICNALTLGLSGAVNVTSETVPIQFNSGSYTITGNYATQRVMKLTQPTITAASSLGITSEASTFYIGGAPISAGSATIANSVALRIAADTSVASGVTNAYGIYVTTPSGGSNQYGVYATGGQAIFGDGGAGVGVTGQAGTGGQAIYGNNTGSGIAAYLNSTSGYALVTNNGNVGFGTVTPSAKVEILAPGSGTYLGGFPALLSIHTADDSPWGLIFTNDTAGSTLDTGMFLKNNGTFEINTGNGVASSTFALALAAITGNAGFGTDTPTSALYVTHPLAQRANGTALAVFDQIENQDIFTASAAGTSKFTISRAGGIGLGGGIGSSPSYGNSSQCLLGGTTASWGSCGGGVNWWNQLGGVVSPTTTSWDFALGGNSTSSALFAVLNMNPAINSFPQATIAGRLNVSDDLRRTTPGPIATISGRTEQVALYINNNGNGDLITASRGGQTKFTVDGRGNLVLGNPTARLTQTTPTISTGNTNATLTLNGDSTGNVQFFSSSNTISSAGTLTIAGTQTINGTSGTALNIANTGITTDINLQNGETIDNDTDGTVKITRQAGSSSAENLQISDGTQSVRFSTNFTGSAFNSLVQAGDAGIIYTTGTQNFGSLTIGAWSNISGGAGFRMQKDGVTMHRTSSNGFAALTIDQVGTNDLFTASSSGTPKFVIKNDGKTGIQTKLPNYPLQIGDGSSNTNNLAIYSNSNMASFFGTFTDNAIWSVNRDIQAGTFVDTAQAHAEIRLQSAASDSSITFWTTTSNNTQATQRMTLDKNGHLGIGTTTIPTESNLVLDFNSTTEGGQVQLNPGSSGSVAYFFDVFSDSLRILSGTTTGSTGTLNTITGSTFTLNSQTTLTASSVTTINTAGSVAWNGLTTLTLAGVVVVPDGSVTAPGFGFSTNPDTGFYYSTNQINFAVNGTRGMYIDSTWDVHIDNGVYAASNWQWGVSSDIATSSERCNTTSEWCLSRVGGVSKLALTTGGALLITGALSQSQATVDVAEDITAFDSSIEAGDIVISDTYNQNESRLAIQAVASKSNKPYQGSIIGAISTEPGIILNDAQGEGRQLPYDTTQKHLAIAGRIPIKVTTINGKIKTGDLVTSSEIPGMGMKATKAGTTLGIAMTDFEDNGSTQSAKLINGNWQIQDRVCNTNEADCYDYQKVLVLVSMGWNDPDVKLTSTGNLTINDNNPNLGLELPHTYTLRDPFGLPIDRIGAYGEIISAKITAGFINARQISTNSLNVATANVFIAGQSLRDYITAIVNETINGQNFNSPIASSDQIHTNTINPLSTNQDAKLAIKLNDNNGASKLEIQNSSGSALASFDSLGNASISGNLLVDGNSTVSGTLRASKIIADEIEGLNIKTSTIAANYITNNYYVATPGAFPTLPAENSNNSVNQIAGNYINIASYSSQLANISNLTGDNAIFNSSLTVFGQTTLTDTSIVGQLAVGGNLIIADEAINVLGGDLNLQPLRQGGLSIMAGLIYVDTNGNVTFEADAKIKGTLYANQIAPLPGKDLNIKLASDSAAINKLVVKGASGAGVLAINNLGDLIASGEASFAKLNINNIVGTAYALSPTEVVASGSAGTVTLKAFKTEVTVNNKLVTPNSLIYITPLGSTANENIYLMRQVPNQSFTVGISNPISQDVKFNFLIVN